MDKTQSEKIVFMGSGAFAVPSLSALVSAGRRPLLVLTATDKPARRGMRLTRNPVAEFAANAGIETIKTDTLKDDAVSRGIAALSPDVFVVAAFGIIIPKRVLKIARLGALNVHGSLLPKYRGASPVQAALLNAEKETGVTVMRLDEKMDTGPILAQKTVPIADTDNALALSGKLAEAGADLLLSVLPGYLDGTASPSPQNETEASYCGLIGKSDGEILWSDRAESILAKVRAYYPWPGTSGYFSAAGGRRVRVAVTAAALSSFPFAPGAQAGSLALDISGDIHVKCGEGALKIVSVRPEGKKEMSGREFARGRLFLFQSSDQP